MLPASIKIRRTLASLAAPWVAALDTHPGGNSLASAASLTWKSNWKRYSPDWASIVMGGGAAAGWANAADGISANPQISPRASPAKFLFIPIPELFGRTIGQS